MSSSANTTQKSQATLKKQSNVTQADTTYFVDAFKEVSINAFVGKINFANKTSDGDKDPVLTVTLPLPELYSLGRQIISIFSDPEIKKFIARNQQSFQAEINSIAVKEKV